MTEEELRKELEIIRVYYPHDIPKPEPRMFKLIAFTLAFSFCIWMLLQ